MAAALIGASVPDLGPEIADALPRRRPALLRYGVASATAAAAAALQLSGYPDDFGDRADATKVLLALAPWLLALPWLKHLDLRPVVWFFLCLFCGIVAPVLVWKVVYRALSLPYRDWKIEHWHVARCRAVRALDAVVLVDSPEAPSRLRGRGEARWRSLLRLAWALVLTGFVVLAATDVALVDQGAPDWAKDIWLLVAAVVAVGHLLGELVLGLLDRRRLPEPHEYRDPAQ